MKKEYTDDFKKESVRLFESGNVSRAQVARELGVNQHTFYNWIEKYGNKPKDPDVCSEDLSAENRRLRRELKRVELERDILKKAVSIFSKELP